MKTYPPVPHVEKADRALLDGGHLWLQELVDGAQLRFQLLESGAVRFGDSERIFGDEVPPVYRYAVRHVRETLDREALRAAVDDVESVVFFAEATVRRSLAYDWGRTPPILGFDVHDDDRGAFLPPDGVERVYERLGLQPVNTFEKEARAVDFDPEDYEVPESAWRAGPAAGVVVRDKTGNVAKLPNPELDRHREGDPGDEPLEGSAEELAARLTTDGVLRRVAVDLEASEGYVAFEPLFERAMDAIYREAGDRLDHGGMQPEPGELRSAVAARTREWLDGRGSDV